MTAEMPLIIPARDGWEPSLWTILKLQVIARKRGWHADWECVSVSNSEPIHSTLFINSHPAIDHERLVAVKRHGRWTLTTEGEWIDEPEPTAKTSKGKRKPKQLRGVQQNSDRRSHRLLACLDAIIGFCSRRLDARPVRHHRPQHAPETGAAEGAK